MAEDTNRNPPACTIRTLIADDHQLVRTHISEILRENPIFQICGHAKDGTEAVDKVRQLVPDFVILDISMPGLNGLEVARQIRQIAPSAKIIILTMHESPHLETAALQAGANAIVSKRLATQSLTIAMDHLFFGGPAETNGALKE
jgi:DNA-binding NarL/FixJ family response regulator